MSAENSPRIAQHWRLRGIRLRLEGSNCHHCGKVHFPPRTICPDCGMDNRIDPIENNHQSEQNLQEPSQETTPEI